MRKAWDKCGRYVLFFLAYSVIGWAYEVFLEVVVYRWGYSDRGVLFGPYCPVYGFGALAFIFLLGKLVRSERPLWLRLLLTFLACMLVATAIELAASYILEAITGSWPWQTYVDYAVNFQGRIALSPSIRFGLGGLLFLFVLQPLFEKAVGCLSEPGRRRVSLLVLIWLTADLCATVALKLL